MTTIANLVQQTTSTIGTGNITLTAADGRQTFNAAFGTGGTDVFYYFIMNRAAAEWEVGTGHLFDSTTLVRDTVLNSSNANAAVNFSAGTKDVTNAVPASDAAQLVNLASTANGKGASLIGIEDSGALITATTVEGALAELATTASQKANLTGADFTGSCSISKGSSPTLVYTETSSNTYARNIIAGGIYYVQCGASGSGGGSASKGTFQFTGYFGTTLASMQANIDATGSFLVRNGATSRHSLKGDGSVQFHAFGAGTLTSDASGNITSSSDENIKERIEPLALGLSFVKACADNGALTTFFYNGLSGLDRMNRYAGFVAQRVAAAAGALASLVTGETADGRMTLQDRALLAAAYRAIAELEQKNAALEARINALGG